MREGYRERLATFASFATMALMGVTVSVLGPSLPGIARRTGVSLAGAAVLFTLFAGGSLAATLVMSQLADRPVRHALLVAGSLLLGLMLWFTAASPTLAFMGAGLLLAGLGLSCAAVSPNVIVTERYGPRAPSALNALHMCVGIGAFLGPLAVGLASLQGSDFTLVFRALGACEILLALVWAICRPPRPARIAGRPGLRTLRVLQPTLLLALVALLYVGAEQTFGGWIFTYASQARGLDAAAAGAVTSLFWLAMIVGRLAATQILRHVHPLALIAGGIAFGAAGIAAVLLAGPGQAGLWLGTGLTGLAFGPLFPTTLATGAQAAPDRVGLTSSLLVAAGSVGTMILPWLGGLMIPRWGLSASLVLAEVALAAMLLCLRVFASRRLPAA